MSLTLYVLFEWQFLYEVKSCRILKNLWLLTSYKNCDSKELASREWVSEIINLNLVDIRFNTEDAPYRTARAVGGGRSWRISSALNLLSILSIKAIFSFSIKAIFVYRQTIFHNKSHNDKTSISVAQMTFYIMNHNNMVYWFYDQIN